jgi:hypothetical protein
MPQGIRAVASCTQVGSLRAPVLLLIVLAVFALPWLAVTLNASDQDGSPSANTADTKPRGRFLKFRSESVVGTGPGGPYTSEQLEAMRRLEALGYLDGVTTAPAISGVTRMLSGRTWTGYNFYVSGHGQEATLMDMNGKVLHTWSHDHRSAFTRAKDRRFPEHWRRAHLYENGDVLAIWEGRALIRLDKDSRAKWTYDGKTHHDIYVDRGDRIYVLGRNPAVIPAIHKTQPVLEDFIDILDEDGRLLRRISVLQCFENSSYRHMILESAQTLVARRLAVDHKHPGDMFHTNSIQVFDGSQQRFSPRYRKGNMLISLREPGILAIINPDKESVVWAVSGSWRRQHDATLLANGRILLFDNRGLGEISRVIEFDPDSEEVRWEYRGDPPEAFYSSTCGTNQRLPNGNTLITESNNGRAFEVAPDGTVVWEFVSPHRAGKDKELIATLFDMVRIPSDWDLGWLEH